MTDAQLASDFPYSITLQIETQAQGGNVERALAWSEVGFLDTAGVLGVEAFVGTACEVDRATPVAGVEIEQQPVRSVILPVNREHGQTVRITFISPEPVILRVASVEQAIQPLDVSKGDRPGRVGR